MLHKPMRANANPPKVRKAHNGNTSDGNATGSLWRRSLQANQWQANQCEPRRTNGRRDMVSTSSGKPRFPTIPAVLPEWAVNYRKRELEPIVTNRVTSRRSISSQFGNWGSDPRRDREIVLGPPQRLLRNSKTGKGLRRYFTHQLFTGHV